MNLIEFILVQKQELNLNSKVAENIFISTILKKNVHLLMDSWLIVNGSPYLQNIILMIFVNTAAIQRTQHCYCCVLISVKYKI
jgi:hypothetical protein